MRHQFKSLIPTISLVCGLVGNASVQAALYDRGGGLIYDDVLNVTWLQDASHSKTSGFSNNNLMSWEDAQSWASNLVYHDSIRNIEITGWHLPIISPLDGMAFNNTASFNGSTDGGFNITNPKSSLSYMYYVNLGLLGNYSPNGIYQSNFGIFRNGTFNGIDQSSNGQNDVNLIKNLQSYSFWYGTESPDNSSYAWFFNTDFGSQGLYLKNAKLAVWAVHDGDIANVPIPASIWLFGTTILSLLRLHKRGLSKPTTQTFRHIV